MPPPHTDLFCLILPLYPCIQLSFMSLFHLRRLQQLSRCIVYFTISPLPFTADCCLLSIIFHHARPRSHPNWLLFIVWLFVPLSLLSFPPESKPARHIIRALVLCSALVVIVTATTAESTTLTPLVIGRLFEICLSWFGLWRSQFLMWKWQEKSRKTKNQSPHQWCSEPPWANQVQLNPGQGQMTINRAVL